MPSVCGARGANCLHSETQLQQPPGHHTASSPRVRPPVVPVIYRLSVSISAKFEVRGGGGQRLTSTVLHRPVLPAPPGIARAHSLLAGTRPASAARHRCFWRSDRPIAEASTHETLSWVRAELRPTIGPTLLRVGWPWPKRRPSLPRWSRNWLGLGTAVGRQSR